MFNYAWLRQLKKHQLVTTQLPRERVIQNFKKLGPMKTKCQEKIKIGNGRVKTKKSYVKKSTSDKKNHRDDSTIRRMKSDEIYSKMFTSYKKNRNRLTVKK